MKKTFLLFMFAFTTLNLVLAQTCGVSDYTTGNSVSFGDETMQGQTFALTCGASLTAVQFGTNTANAGGTITARIKTSACSGTTLATKSKTGITVGANTITFDAPVSLTQGVTYFLEFTGSGTTPNVPLIRSHNGSVYSGGNLYYTRPGAGNTCVSDGGYDLAFALVFSVLPIELIQFDATTEGGKNTLTWATASETNNKGFDIERSRDGMTFTTIGNVKAIGKAGNYNFTDAEPVNGTNYYRLRQIDNDGTETYSKVVSVTNKGGKALKVYPTLVSNGFLTVDSESSDYAIYNIVGQQVQSGKTTQRIDVSALAKGTYILKVGTEQAKFVKQ